MMKTVIRIEGADGCGLWRSRYENGETVIYSHTEYLQIEERHRGEDFPSLDRDTQLLNFFNVTGRDAESFYFAFRSLNQLATALTNDELKECIVVLGFKVLMLDVIDYFESDYQVVFIKESITETKDISFMFI